MKIIIDATPQEIAEFPVRITNEVLALIESFDEDEAPETIAAEPPHTPMDSIAKMFGRKDEEHSGLLSAEDVREIIGIVKAKLGKKG